MSDEEKVSGLQELENRVRDLEIVCRAALMLLADYVAAARPGWNPVEHFSYYGEMGKQLRRLYAQKALAAQKKAGEKELEPEHAEA